DAHSAYAGTRLGVVLFLRIVRRIVFVFGIRTFRHDCEDLQNRRVGQATVAVVELKAGALHTDSPTESAFIT
ncbi:MAG: hypothetical protein OER77_02770, partial [Myxococcales bacterium]|nr:hypothetical protein [Myxococcales bacterium]